MRSLAISDFADSLNISRDTAKRLFRKQVFPMEWLTKTAGGHWRVEMDEARSQASRWLYQRWKLFSRKPQASQSLPEPEALDELAMTLMEIRILDEPASSENIEELTLIMLNSPEAAKKFSKFRDSFRLEQSSDREQAILLVFRKLWEIKDRWGMDYEPRLADLAEAMNMSVASLYRHPFGKDVIKEARKDMRDYLQGSVKEVHSLSQSFDGEITPLVIQKYLVVSKKKAEALFEEWEATFTETEFHQLSENPAKLEVAFQGSSHQSERPKASEFQRDAKKVRDRKRNKLKRQFMVQWEETTTRNGTWLFLEAVPRYEFEEIAKFREGKVIRGKLESLQARLENKKEPLGSVSEDSGEIISKGLNGIPLSEAPCDSFKAGIDRLIDALKKLYFEDERFRGVNWENVRDQAPISKEEARKITDKPY